MTASSLFLSLLSTIPALLLGVPIYRLARRYRVASLPVALLAGAVVSAACAGLIGAIAGLPLKGSAATTAVFAYFGLWASGFFWLGVRRLHREIT
jgi:hypothetical protein